MDPRMLLLELVDLGNRTIVTETSDAPRARDMAKVTTGLPLILPIVVTSPNESVTVAKSVSLTARPPPSGTSVCDSA